MTKEAERKITKRLCDDFRMLVNDGYIVVGVFLQGSQNYGVDDEYSDIDTKAIVVPKLEDIIFNRKPVSYTYVHENGEHTDIKDIRLMHNSFKQQNINSLEILFTKYYVLNSDFVTIYQKVIDNNELIAHYNKVAAVKTMRGMAMQLYYALDHKHPSRAQEFEAWGFDPKSLSNIVRVREFIHRYVLGGAYKECLIPTDKKYIIGLKRNTLNLTKEKALELAEEERRLIDQIYEDFMNSPEASLTPNLEAEKILDEAVSGVIKKSISKELAIEKKQYSFFRT